MKTKKLTGDRDRDFIKRQWPKLSFREKAAYIFHYYGIALVALIILAGFAVFFIRDYRSAKADEAFYVMVLDREMDEDKVAALEEKLQVSLGLDPDTQECVIETGYSSEAANAQSEATVASYMRSGRVDLVIASEEDFNKYAVTGYLAELSPEEYGIEDSGKCFYAEQVDYSEGGAVTDLPYHPHECTEGSAEYGIYLNGGSWDGMVLGQMSNSPHSNLCREAMEFFL